MGRGARCPARQPATKSDKTCQASVQASVQAFSVRAPMLRALPQLPTFTADRQQRQGSRPFPPGPSIPSRGPRAIHRLHLLRDRPLQILRRPVPAHLLH